MKWKVRFWRTVSSGIVAKGEGVVVGWIEGGSARNGGHGGWNGEKKRKTVHGSSDAWMGGVGHGGSWSRASHDSGGRKTGVQCPETVILLDSF